MMAWLRQKGWLLILLVGIVFVGMRWWYLSASVTPTGVKRVFTVYAKRYEYNPNVIHVNVGDEVTIRLVSQDVHHGLYLDGYARETSARPGEIGVIRFVADRKGRFPFRCSVTCGSFHPYMIGYLKVGPNTRFHTALIMIVFISGGVLFYLVKKGRTR